MTGKKSSSASSKVNKTFKESEVVVERAKLLIAHSRELLEQANALHRRHMSVVQENDSVPERRAESHERHSSNAGTELF